MTLEALTELKEHVLAVLPPDAIGEAIEAEIEHGELCLTVGRATIVKVLTRLRDDPNCAFTCLVDLCGVDRPAREQRFDVVYNLLSVTANLRCRVKVRTDEETPRAVGRRGLQRRRLVRARGLGSVRHLFFR